jgi:hypothetical protein
MMYQSRSHFTVPALHCCSLHDNETERGCGFIIFTIAYCKNYCVVSALLDGDNGNKDKKTVIRCGSKHGYVQFCVYYLSSMIKEKEKDH